MIKGVAWWDEKRREAYRKNHGCCWACGANELLDAHEAYNIDYFLGRMFFVEVTALCKDCHRFIHAGHTKVMLDRGIFTFKDVERIFKRGIKLLKDNKLRTGIGLFYVLSSIREDYRSKDCSWVFECLDVVSFELLGAPAPWHKWRMVFEGKEYPPRFLTPEASAKFYDSLKVRTYE